MTDVNDDMETREISVRLPPQMWKRIDRLIEAMEHTVDLQGFVVELLDHVQQGVYRSGAWERDWLERCAGPEAVQAACELDEDPL